MLSDGCSSLKEPLLSSSHSGQWLSFLTSQRTQRAGSHLQREHWQSSVCSKTRAVDRQSRFQRQIPKDLIIKWLVYVWHSQIGESGGWLWACRLWCSRFRLVFISPLLLLRWDTLLACLCCSLLLLGWLVQLSVSGYLGMNHVHYFKQFKANIVTQAFW